MICPFFQLQRLDEDYLVIVNIIVECNKINFSVQWSLELYSVYSIGLLSFYTLLFYFRQTGLKNANLISFQSCLPLFICFWSLGCSTLLYLKCRSFNHFSFTIIAKQLLENVLMFVNLFTLYMSFQLSKIQIIIKKSIIT